MISARAEAQLKANVLALSADLPGITFGYIGNFERWGDDRSFRLFLPHPDRVGGSEDAVFLGRFTDLPKAVANWAGIEAHARHLYHNGTRRV
jgi:hypothetical protein